jgi:signal transduction histidine kinase
MLVVPRLCYEIPGFLDRHLFERSELAERQTALDAMAHEVASGGVARWNDADWQRSLRDAADQANIGVRLLDGSGRERLSAGRIQSKENAVREIALWENGRVAGNALLYESKPVGFWANSLAVAAAVCAILFIGYQMGRVVVRPLEAMSRAARRIASGDLDFTLPRSTVLEVAEVRAAFESMGDGLRESLTRQAALEEERRFFIGAIAHDLRTPLFALRGFLSRLERGHARDPEKTARYIMICGRKAEQLERLVSDLFVFARTDTLDRSIRLETLDFRNLLEDIVDEYCPLARDKDIALDFDAATEPCLVLADPYLLKRAIGNLLDNAIRHTPSEGRIKAVLRKTSERIEFVIEDSGPGIAASDLPRLFEAFYRGDKSRNPAYGGTGLGLTIARRIMLAHQGDLTAQNRGPSGAMFTGWMARM